MDDSNSRRRRGAGVVTANACTECRKKRSKCDGQKPCSRCVAVKAECIYEVPVRQSKETMRAEIEMLQTHRRQSERVFSAMLSGPKTQETFNRLRNGESLEMVAEWLDKITSQGVGSSQNVTTFPPTANNMAINHTLSMAETVVNYAGFNDSETSDEHSAQQTWSPWQSDSQRNSAPASRNQSEDAMNWTPDVELTQQGFEQRNTSSRPLVGVWPSHLAATRDASQSIRGRGQEQVLGSSIKEHEHPSRPRSPVGTWTEVTQDIHFVEHLMALYFCWEYPTFASLSKEHFLADFRAGRPRYCSSLLVNAMLALGCRFSTLPESRVNLDDPTTSGDHFFAEAKRLLAEDDFHSLTTIQALGLISIREASCGRDTESFYYSGQAIRLAVEAGLHIQARENSEDGVRAATFWGAFALDQAWSLTVGRIPHFSRAADLVAKPAIIDEVESSEWVPYTDEGVPEIKYANQPSNVRSVYKCFCELAELVHQSLYVLYVPGRSLTSSELLTVYTRYLNWYSSLPESLRLGHNFTPAVLFAHLYYHFAILSLFRPFIKLRLIGSRVSPRDVCTQAADAISTLVRSYDQLYTLQRTPSFVPYIVLASCVVHTARVAGTGSGWIQFRQGVQDLKDMCVCHGFARRAPDIVKVLAENWGLENAVGDENPLTSEEVKQLCSPSPSSLNFFCPNMVDYISSGGPESSSAIFAPFPMQGHPVLAGDNEMEDYGFSRVANEGKYLRGDI